MDRDKYLAVPSVTIENPEIVARFTKTTTNHYPEIPITVSGIDYAALDRHVPFADYVALRSAADSLDSAGLTPASARPMVGHTVSGVLEHGLGDFRYLGDELAGVGQARPDRVSCLAVGVDIAWSSPSQSRRCLWCSGSPTTQPPGM